MFLAKISRIPADPRRRAVRASASDRRDIRGRRSKAARALRAEQSRCVVEQLLRAVAETRQGAAQASAVSHEAADVGDRFRRIVFALRRQSGSAARNWRALRME